MKAFSQLFFAAVLLIPSVTCRHYDDDVFDQVPESYSFDSYDTETMPDEELIEEKAIASKFEFLGEGPCRITGESKISRFVNVVHSGEVDQCAEECDQDHHCRGFEYRFDGAYHDCALISMTPTHKSDAYKPGGRECYKRMDSYSR